jgi:hypothetical protein
MKAKKIGFDIVDKLPKGIWMTVKNASVLWGINKHMIYMLANSHLIDVVVYLDKIHIRVDNVKRGENGKLTILPPTCS